MQLAINLCEVANARDCDIVAGITLIIIFAILGAIIVFLRKTNHKDKLIIKILRGIFICLEVVVFILTIAIIGEFLKFQTKVWNVEKYVKNLPVSNLESFYDNERNFLAAYKTLIPVETIAKGYGDSYEVRYSVDGNTAPLMKINKINCIDTDYLNFKLDDPFEVTCSGVHFTVPLYKTKNIVKAPCLTDLLHSNHSRCQCFKNKEIKMKSGIYLDTDKKVVYEVKGDSKYKYTLKETN